MEIKREYYLNKLITRQNNGLVKVITGIRRCGKSYLLFTIFVRYLKEHGVDDGHIIRIALDDLEYAALRDSMSLYRYIKSKLEELKLKEFANMALTICKKCFYK